MKARTAQKINRAVQLNESDKDLDLNNKQKITSDTIGYIFIPQQSNYTIRIIFMVFTNHKNWNKYKISYSRKSSLLVTLPFIG